MSEGPSMNDFNQKQVNAIKALERAFKKCAEAKLSFQGMDDSLLVLDSC